MDHLAQRLERDMAFDGGRGIRKLLRLKRETVYKKNFSFIYTCHRRVGGWLLKRRLDGSLYKAAPSRRQRDLSGIDLGL